MEQLSGFTDFQPNTEFPNEINPNNFNVIIPQPFTLSRHSDSDKAKIVEEAVEKTRSWESNMFDFFQEWNETANNYRMIPRTSRNKPTGLFNSVSGETNRSIKTLASIWFRMLTASDPYFEVYGQGLSPAGTPLTEQDLYATREVISEQLRYFKFKPKLMRALTSLAAFGSVIVEEPFISFPLGDVNKRMEGTDFQLRSLLQTAFNPYVMDLDCSEFIATIDYLNKYSARELAYRNGDIWDKETIEKLLAERDSYSDGSSNAHATSIYTEIQKRKQRANYRDLGNHLIEVINYHGKLDLDNPIFEDYWNSEGRTDDIRFTDWTVGIMDASNLVRFHTTPYGSWQFLFKTAHTDLFENEPLGYGVGKFGKRIQRELNTTQSRAQDALMMGVYMMHIVGKYAGLKSSQLNIKPFNVIELDDPDQFKQMRMDLNAIGQALSMTGILKEDFRAISRATSNLQATNSSATATEASLTQSESLRGNSVIAEIIAETLLRDHLLQVHRNNLIGLDAPIAINITGSFGNIYGQYNRHNLPENVGIKVSVTTDKDYRPERLRKILEAIQIVSSVRSIFPESINAVVPLLEEYFRGIGIDPRLMRQPKPLPDLLSERMQRMGKSNMQGSVGEEVGSEIASELAGTPSVSTPMGDIPTSPLASSLIQGVS